MARANAGDVEGLVALYERNAVLAFPKGTIATGHEEIRAVYRDSWPRHRYSPRAANARPS